MAFLVKTQLFQALVLLLGLGLLLSACSSTGNDTNSLSYLAKSDIDTVADIHRKRSNTLLQQLANKLYRRNPLYCKQNGNQLETCINMALGDNHSWRQARLGDCSGSKCIERGLQQDFTGDRVLALLAGLEDMLDAAYDNKKEFYLTDELDPQKLYNVARNIEITVWRLANRRDESGKRYILTDAINGRQRNLSYERLFGKLISIQDTLAEVIAERDNRRIKNVIQRLATAVFLPI